MKKIKTILVESTGGVFSSDWYDSVSKKITLGINENKKPTIIQLKVDESNFELIPSGVKVSNDKFYEICNSDYSKKRVMIAFINWCKKNDYTLIKSNSNGQRFIILNKD